MFSTIRFLSRSHLKFSDLVRSAMSAATSVALATGHALPKDHLSIPLCTPNQSLVIYLKWPLSELQQISIIKQTKIFKYGKRKRPPVERGVRIRGSGQETAT